MCAVTILFFMMIHIFSKIVYLSERETDTALLKAQLDGQKIYMEEVQKRNNEFAHFQHDIDNHLLVLSGLTHDNKFLKAEQYINQLHIRCELLSFPVSTGNTVLDILLKEKLSYATSNGVEVACNVRIPGDFNFDDMDLCSIFANILDNAICACINNSSEENKISICAKAHARFLVIEEINTMAMYQPVIEGTGIANIKNLAKKYNGTVEISNSCGAFRISVLLCLAM